MQTVPLFKFLFYFAWMSVLPTGTSVYHVYAWCSGRPEEGTEFPWNGSYRGLPAVIWVLGIEPGSTERSTSALNCPATSPVLWHLFLIPMFRRLSQEDNEFKVSLVTK